MMKKIIRQRLVLVLSGSLLWGLPTSAQTSPPETSSERVSIEDAAKDFTARKGEDIILPALKQLDVVGDATLPAATPADGTLVRRELPTVLQGPIFADFVQGLIGQPVSRESLFRLQQAVQLSMSAGGWPYSLVYLPEQDITDGSVRLVVRESRIGEVRVEGNRYFSTEGYLEALGLHPGEPVDRRRFAPSIAALELNGYRKPIIKVLRGEQSGTTDVVIVTQERKPWRLTVGYNNTGTRSTEEDRITGGFTWGALLGTDHTASLNWSSDPAARHSRSLSANYSIPIRTGVNLSMLASISRLNARVAAPLKQEGTSWQVGLNLDYALAKIGESYQHEVQAGLDFKSSDNNLDYILPPIVFPISGNLTEIVQARVSYTGTLQDKWGYTRGSVDLVGAPGGLSAANHTSDFSQTRVGAKADYVYVKGSLFRSNDLRGAMKDWVWTQRIAWQLSSVNLLGSEQFSAGGSGSVRGYTEGEILGDNGFLFSQELMFPAFSPLHKNDSLRSFAFHDFAITENTDKLPGEGSFAVHSVGAGLRYQFKTHVSANLAYGWQLRDSGNSASTDSGRAHFSLQMSY